MGKLSNALVALGTAMLLAALGLTFFNLRQSNAAAEKDAKIVDVLQKTVAPAAQPAQTAAPEQEQVPDYVLDPDREMPVTQVEGKNYVGLLSIPALDLELPVMAEWDYPSLRVAPCRYTGSVYSDNLVIAAHNYASHFGRLQELTAGDSLSFTDVDGNVFDYTVDDLEIMGPYAVEQMTVGDWDMTLFTCTLGGQQRVTLRCRRV